MVVSYIALYKCWVKNLIAHTSREHTGSYFPTELTEFKIEPP